MNFKKFYRSNRKFKEKTKSLFLLALHEKIGFAERPVFAFKYFIRGAGAGAAFMVLISASAIYADQNNVGPDNLLYSLKRYNENIKTIFVSESEKPSFHLELAERRLEEIKIVEKNNPESSKVSKLARDLELEAEESLESLEVESSDVIVSKMPASKVFRISDKTFAVPKVATPPKSESESVLGGSDHSAAGLASPDLKVEESPLKASNLRVGEADLGDKQSVICDRWRNILYADESAAKYLKIDSDIFEKFNEKCRSFGSGEPPKVDAGEDEDSAKDEDKD